MTNAYDADFYAWTIEQAQLLRERRFADADIANIIEEIETLGRGEKRELRNWLVLVLTHLTKWQAQPSRRSNRWELTITEERLRLQEHLAENQSLVPTLPDAIASVWRQVLVKTMRQTGLPGAALPSICPWSADLILDDGFFLDAER